MMDAKILRSVTREFNKYRYPECMAKVIKNEGNLIKVEFRGTTVSFSCCFDEHFEDYRELLEEKGIKTKIKFVDRKKLKNLQLFS